MPRNLTELRERIRNAQNELDQQRASNRALAENDAATAQEIEAAMEQTRRMSARLQIMRDDLEAEEGRQRGSLPAAGGADDAYTDRRREILRSNEYARAFAYAVQNGITRKRGVGNEHVRILYDALTEGGGTPTGSDGGFLVPEDVQNQIMEQVRTLNPLSQFFGQEQVTAPTGWRATDTAPTQGLLPVNEMGQIQTGEQPKFAKVPYSTSKYALYLPVSNELMTDNVANLFAYLSRWFAKKLVITENGLLAALLQALTAVDISADPLKGIKKALNVDLDPAISAVATIITNQSGYNELDNLLDDNKRPLLQPDPTNATANRIKGRNLAMVSDKTLANVTSGEDQSATTAADIFIGDGRQFATLFRCGSFELSSTDIGGDAWRTDSTELRGIARLGVTKFDAEAMVRRSLTV